MSIATFLSFDAFDLPTLAKTPESRAASERDDAQPDAKASSFWFAFDGWDAGNREDDFVLA